MAGGVDARAALTDRMAQRGDDRVPDVPGHPVDRQDRPPRFLHADRTLRPEGAGADGLGRPPVLREHASQPVSHAARAFQPPQHDRPAVRRREPPGQLCQARAVHAEEDRVAPLQTCQRVVEIHRRRMTGLGYGPIPAVRGIIRVIDNV